MAEFRHQEAAESAIQRLTALAGISLHLNFFEGVAAPDEALHNLERWLSATTSPGLQLQQLVEDQDLGKLLVFLLGASRPIADSLIQNPELASLIFDRAELSRMPTRALVEEQGRTLLAKATSFSHSLDRLRFVRQRWMLPIVVNDLARTWPEPQVWRALSEVAEALIGLALDVVWQERGEGECPIMIVGFGKLGGGELNYSSDVDLVYVFRDGGEDIRLTRICEALTRALTDPMGRGMLYRVDLRLRPFGGTGPVAASMGSIEGYYDLYAQPWEIQALLRSKPIAGPAELAERWEAMRLKHCFRPTLSAEALDESLAMRSRTEQSVRSNDIKRGSGGIRDVEFLTQILQQVHGHRSADLQARPTLDALAALEAHGIIDHAVCQSLSDSYTFLRQLEHRLQFVGDQQTHSIPADPLARHRLATLMGLADWRELEREIDLQRRTIGSLYQSTLHPQAEFSSDRTFVADSLGMHAHAALQWFDTLPESEAFYTSLVQNRDSLDRVRTIIQMAPRLVPFFKASIPLTELLLSGEIEEEFDGAAQIDALAMDSSPRVVAENYSAAWTHACAKWSLTRGGVLWRELSNLADAMIRHCARRLYGEFDIVGLGSLGLEDMMPDSDADLILFVSSDGHHLDAETQAQFLLSLIGQLKRLGAPIELDLRLRPEGGKGLLVRTYEGFAEYELQAMEMWERFALGQSRLILGSEDALRIVLKAAYAQPLTPERLKELLAMKKRIETERVLPQHMRREVKLGHGGLADIEWFIHLHEMRYPTATKAGESLHMEDRIRSLGRARLINAIEVEELLAAREHLLTLRLRLALQGLKKDLLPENPDKLDRLAIASGFDNGNAFLAHHERIIDTVRAIYREGLDRLKA